MDVSIRKYKESDYPMISAWWRSAGADSPPEALLPEGSTFILSVDDVPTVSVTLYYTNCKAMCWVENFVGNPEMKGPRRKAAGHALMSFIESKAKENGFTHLWGTSYREATTKRYKEFGFTEAMKNVSGLTVSPCLPF